MEEKKVIKISLSTFLLIIAIIIICVMAFFIYKLNIENRNSTKQVSQLNNQINTLEHNMSTMQEKTKNTTNVSNITENKKTTNNITDTKEIVSLIENLGEYEYLKVTNIKEENNKYLVDADYYVPTPITEKEYKELVSSKEITLNNKEYVYDDSNTSELEKYGRVYLKDKTDENGYRIEKVKEGYIFIYEAGGVMDLINEVKQHYTFYLDENTKAFEVATAMDNIELSKYLADDENKDIAQYFTTVDYDKENKEFILSVDKR